MDPSEFIRIVDGKLEVFVTGLSGMFTIIQREQNIPNGVQRIYRTEWICDKIIPSLRDNPQVPIVLDCRMENFYMNTIAKSIIKFLDLSPTQVTILTTTDPKNLFGEYQYKIDRLADVDYCYFYTNLIAEDLNWEDIEIDVPIISLSARPTENRAKFTKNLLDTCGDKIRASFGKLTNYPLTEDQRKLYTDLMNPYPFPVDQYTDNKVLDNMLTIQHGTGQNLYKSLIAIVNETNDFDNDHIQLSEKSFKHFAWHQIPIFNASKGQVEVVRSMGFDMFDDIIDHSYDCASSDYVQKLKILNEVAKFLKKYPTLEDVNMLRKSIFHRLKFNNQILRSLYDQRLGKPWPYYG